MGFSLPREGCYWKKDEGRGPKRDRSEGEKRDGKNGHGGVSRPALLVLKSKTKSFRPNYSLPTYL